MMYIVIDKNKCTGCNLCVFSCPENALSSYGEAEVDIQKCNGCRICIRFCHADAISVKPVKEEA